MADAPNIVTIVVDPEFGDRLHEVAKKTAVWIVDTPNNQAAAEVVRAQKPEHRRPSGVTTFQVDRDSTPEQWCANILAVVDLHHGEYSHDSRYTVVEVIGAPLTIKLRQVFSEYELNAFAERASGFRASRSNSAG